MPITTTEVFNSLKDVVKNIQSISPQEKADWSNIVNEIIYEEIIQRNPNNYIVTHLIDVELNKVSYPKPSNYPKEINKKYSTGIFKTQTGATYGRLRYDQLTDDFTVNKVLTGSNSGATATIEEIVQETGAISGYFRLSNISTDKDFEDNEPITDTETGVAVVNGIILKYDDMDVSNYLNELPETNKGSNELGFYSTLDSIVLTPAPTSEELYEMYFFPVLDKMTESNYADSTFIDIRAKEGNYKKLIVDLMLIEYQRKFQNTIPKENAMIEARATLDSFFEDITETSQIFNI